MLIKFSQAIVETLYFKRIFMMYYDFDFLTQDVERNIYIILKSRNRKHLA